MKTLNEKDATALSTPNEKDEIKMITLNESQSVSVQLVQRGLLLMLALGLFSLTGVMRNSFLSWIPLYYTIIISCIVAIKLSFPSWISEKELTKEEKITFLPYRVNLHLVCLMALVQVNSTVLALVSGFCLLTTVYLSRTGNYAFGVEHVNVVVKHPKRVQALFAILGVALLYTILITIAYLIVNLFNLI